MSASGLLSKLQRSKPQGNSLPPDTCSYCRRSLPGGYFELAGRPACFSCASQIKIVEPAQQSSSESAPLAPYARSLFFGIGAAIVGCAGYALFGILTGISIGWISLAVGYLVGWAMKQGSRGVGGISYQVTAVLLTYAAVAVAFVPIAIHDRMLGISDIASAYGIATNGEGATLGDLLLTIPTLLGIGLLSPLLRFSTSFASGAINLLILSAGMRTAWHEMAPWRANARAD